MRIVRLRFKNLNSLYGEWEIDFSHPVFSSEGIFAITGPTGAGKTTLLDAICLALYGCTPRLGKITKNGNEIMSRHTGECFAELSFETQAGIFRSYWSQHRAHKKPGGELQNPRHEIVDARTGRILDASLRGVALHVEEITGMDFERFTRSILLAQGGFAAFLQASPSERAPILEQITGTEIYSQISVCVHERLTKEKEALNFLKAEIAGISLLSSEEEALLKQDLIRKSTEETGLTEQLNTINEAISWLETIERLQQDLKELDANYDQLEQDSQDFKEGQLKLDKASCASRLEALHAGLNALRKQENEDAEHYRKEQESLPTLKQQTIEKAGRLKQARQESVDRRQKLKIRMPFLQQLRLLDQKLIDKKMACCHTKKVIQEEKQQISVIKKQKTQQEEHYRQISITYQDLVDYLTQHKSDANLGLHFAGIKERLHALHRLHQEIVENQRLQHKVNADCLQAEQQLKGSQLELKLRKKELEKKRAEIQQNQHLLEQGLAGQLLREYRSQKESLLREQILLKKIADLEAQRKELQAGKPCPLCGSMHHPYIQGNTPEIGETDKRIQALSIIIEKAESLESSLQQQEKEQTQLFVQHTETEKAALAAENTHNNACRRQYELNTQITQKQQEFNRNHQEVSTLLHSFGITELNNEALLIPLSALEQRLKRWQEQQEEKQNIEHKANEISTEIKRLNAIVETQNKALQSKETYLAELKQDYEQLNQQRITIYGNTQADEEEQYLNLAIEQAEIEEQQAAALHQSVQTQYMEAQTRIASLLQRRQQRKPELEKQEQEFISQCHDAGFADEAEFLTALLPAAYYKTLEAQAKQLQERRLQLLAQKKDRTVRLEQEIAKNLHTLPLARLKEEQIQTQTYLSKLRDKISALKHQIYANGQVKEQLKEKQTFIQAQQKECLRWEDLHYLIGSADGKKYRNFAQGLSFEIMVRHANQQLQNMTDRYLLVRDTTQPLELNVIDNYQAGEVRSIKNLSGGESFIVSLALALGLSNMASTNVRVDSLFLDEGFGTLDEEALDSALSTLASLQQEGKLIGVISHMPALKTRISSQIQIKPGAGGRSYLLGLGCRSIS